MKSIRLTMIVYFLLLIALALGGVSALAYQTASKTLHDKQASTDDLIQAQFKTQSQEVRATLDRRILRQAQLLASKAQSVPVGNGVFHLVSAAGAGAGPTSRLLDPLLLAPLTMPSKDFLANYMTFRLTPPGGRPLATEIQIPVAAVDFYMPMDEDHVLDVFQTYRRSGVAAQRSASLNDHWLTLHDEFRRGAEDLDEEYDDIELDGRTMRRVTLRTRVTQRFVGGPFRYPFGQFNPKSKGPDNSKIKSSTANKGPSETQSPKAAPKAPGPGQPGASVFFIQYAGDAAPVEEQISAFESQRNEKLAGTHAQTRIALAHVRQRLFWIAVLTFAGIVVGGYLLVRLGLAPLARLSDAVSKISEKNFQLQVDAASLPIELQPIAERLRHSLEQLSKAFAYEKQAAADISHELRTPLAALMTTLDVALRKQRTPLEYREILEECRASGQHMAHLVERLMALARLDAGVERTSLQVVDVADLAHQCADMVRSLTDEQHLELRTHLPEPISTMTDANKLREILLNLLHNAIAYNKPNGTIELTVDRSPGCVRLAVRDTGIGIAPEARAHLFERFFRGDPSRHSDTPHCGLGLAIVKSYVELLGGTISVDSGPAGSTFEITLPLRDQDTAIQVRSLQAVSN